MIRKHLPRFVLFTTLFLIAAPVMAHDDTLTIRYGSFLAGLLHPILGADHLLAMLSVGIISALMGGRAVWQVPAVFVAMMLVGGLMGYAGLPMIPIEVGIALSVILLGITIGFNWSIPANYLMVGVGLFGIFHGYAHGAEVPDVANVVRYILGFMTGTIIIHLFGVLLGDIPRQFEQMRAIVRVSGVAIALAGVYFLVGALGVI